MPGDARETAHGSVHDAAHDAAHVRAFHERPGFGRLPGIARRFDAALHDDGAPTSDGIAAPDRDRVVRFLESSGFEHLGADRYSGAFAVPHEHLRATWVDLAGPIALRAPFAEFGDDPVAAIHDLDGGRYAVEQVGRFGVLVLELPWTVETSTLRAEAVELSRQADAWRRHIAPRLERGGGHGSG